MILSYYEIFINTDPFSETRNWKGDYGDLLWFGPQNPGTIQELQVPNRYKFHSEIRTETQVLTSYDHSSLGVWCLRSMALYLGAER